MTSKVELSRSDIIKHFDGYVVVILTNPTFGVSVIDSAGTTIL